MFCGEPFQKNIRHPYRNNSHEVTTLRFKEQVLLSCQKRNNQIRKIVAIIARYHMSSRATFMNPEKNILFWRKKCKKLTGRIEQEGGCYTVKKLHQKTNEIADSPTVYTTKRLKKN